MIRNRGLTNYPWKVFQHGHTGWWFTDGDSDVCVIPYSTKTEAEEAMNAQRNRRTDEPRPA
jgi:hypothetical protein